MHKRHLSREQVSIEARKIIKRKKYLNRSDIVRLLRRWQGRRTQHDLAKEIGVPDTTLSYIFKKPGTPGARNPTDLIVNKLGLRTETVYSQMIE